MRWRKLVHYSFAISIRKQFDARTLGYSTSKDPQLKRQSVEVLYSPNGGQTVRAFLPPYTQIQPHPTCVPSPPPLQTPLPITPPPSPSPPPLSPPRLPIRSPRIQNHPINRKLTHNLVPAILPNYPLCKRVRGVFVPPPGADEGVRGVEEDGVGVGVVAFELRWMWMLGRMVER